MKYDSNGKFIKSFGNSGQGPGEFSGCFEIFTDNKNIYAVDTGSSRIVKYDNNGSFLENIALGNGLPLLVKPLSNGNFIATMESVFLEEGENMKEYNVVLLNPKFKVEKKITSNKGKLSDWNYLNSFIPYYITNDAIYIATNSSDKYEINKFNFNGEKLKTITKNYRKVYFTEEELEQFNKYLSNVTGNKLSDNNITKNAVNGLICDDDGNIWILSSRERKEKQEYSEVDIFDSNGNFLISQNIKPISYFGDYFNLDKMIVSIKNKKVYVLDAESGIISVYRIN